MTQRYFTLAEAETLIPRLEKVMAEVRDLKGRVEEKVALWRENRPADAAGEALARSQVDFLLAQISQRLETVTEMGCLPKDLDMGLVDFPARIDGREVYLCWRLGEDAIEFWHGITEGYPGRRPLRAREETR